MAEPEYAVLFDQLFVLDDVIEHAGGTAPAVILCHREGKGASANESHMKSGSTTGIGMGGIRYVSQADWRLGKCEYQRRTHAQELQRMESTHGGNGSKSVEGKRADASVSSSINARSAPERKIQLFRSLFRGRDDVYAHGFVSQKTGKVGYAPAAWNEWTTLPNGKRVPTPPNRRRCKPLTDQVLLDHFTKRDIRMTNVVGLYPMSKESKVWFLAIDFDDAGWRDEITVTRRICEQHGLTPAMERSRSGDGGHLWLFFTEQVEAAQARRMGDVLLTEASDLVHITFRSYDRMFPNQNTLPAGGFGNLIALPLQRVARDKGNSVFVDERFEPYRTSGRIWPQSGESRPSKCMPSLPCPQRWKDRWAVSTGKGHLRNLWPRNPLHIRTQRTRDRMTTPISSRYLTDSMGTIPPNSAERSPHRMSPKPSISSSAICLSYRKTV